MLLDLSKEYLTDMGITRLGDVIAILKHAKAVHDQVRIIFLGVTTVSVSMVSVMLFVSQFSELWR